MCCDRPVSVDDGDRDGGLAFQIEELYALIGYVRSREGLLRLGALITKEYT